MCQNPYNRNKPDRPHHAARHIKRHDSLNIEHSQSLPCGKCPECIRFRTNSWIFRLDQERKRSSSAYFVTLTYDPEHVPYATLEYDYHQMEAHLYDQTLRKKDFQNWMKRLRKAHQGQPLRYYAVGEYGSKTKRPHYHLILFNLDDVNLIQSTWGLGFTLTDEITEGRVRYTLKYVAKPRTKVQRVVPEFSCMSKGIGLNYLSDAIIQYHLTNFLERAFVTWSGGGKFSIPRYYKLKIFDKLQLSLLKNHTSDRFEENLQKQLKAFNYDGRFKNVNDLLKSFELSKLNQRFELRNEVL